MGIVMLLTLAVSAAMVYVLFKALTSFPPGKARMQREISQLKSSIAPWFGDLVPWDNDEMEKLSLNQLNNKIKKGFNKSGKGIFTSIYHEPLITYAFKKYSGKNQALIYARTSNREYAFRIKGNVTQVWMNGQPVGELMEDGTLVSPGGRKLLAKVNRKENEMFLPVLVNNKRVASLANLSKGLDTVNPRAFELLQPMEENEESLLLTVAIMELLKPELAKS